MNPYASHLGEREPIVVLAETAPRLHELMEQIGSDGMGRTFAPGKWNAREIIAHLTHVEVVFGTRFRFALACADYTLQPFDQDDWMRHEPAVSDADAATALEAFCALRAWNLSFLRGLNAADRAKSFSHPEVGTITTDYLIERLAGHDLNHIAQLEAVAAQR